MSHREQDCTVLHILESGICAASKRTNLSLLCRNGTSFRIIPLNIDSVFTFGEVQARHWMLCVCKIEKVRTYM